MKPMKTKIFTENIWQTITSDVKENPDSCMVAVAFFSTGASSMLPLIKGSTIIVNASESIVKSGQTNPTELIKLLKRGVKIYTYDNLHSKMYVIGSNFYIGSSNASNNSAYGLKESMLVTSEKNILNQGKKAIKELCINSLGLTRLKQLEGIYKTPKFVGGFPVKRGTKKTQNQEVYVVRLVIRNGYPKGHEDALEEGFQRATEKIIDLNNKVEHFGWGKKTSFKVGQMVLRVIEKKDGTTVVRPPSTIIEINKWSVNHSIIYVESPNKREKRLSSIEKKLVDISVLKRTGFKTSERIMKVMQLWS